MQNFGYAVSTERSARTVRRTRYVGYVLYAQAKLLSECDDL